MSGSTRRSILREETAGAHAALDETVGAFTDRPDYDRYLTALQAFRVPVEERIAAVRWPPFMAGWRPGRIGGEIGADMADLGLPAGPPVAAGDVDDTSDLMGALYVLEGSALGARILVARARGLGLTERYGARHLHAQARSLANMKAFFALLEACPDLDLDRSARAAVATFENARLAFEGKADA